MNWEHLSEAERLAWEREHGTMPPGYRATGPVEWFSKRHDEFGKCACGVETDRWVLVNLRTGECPGHSPDNKINQPRGLIGDAMPWCQGCEDRHSLAVLEVRQQNPAILPSVRAAEAEMLAAMKPLLEAA